MEENLSIANEKVVSVDRTKISDNQVERVLKLKEDLITNLDGQMTLNKILPWPHLILLCIAPILSIGGFLYVAISEKGLNNEKINNEILAYINIFLPHLLQYAFILSFIIPIYKVVSFIVRRNLELHEQRMLIIAKISFFTSFLITSNNISDETFREFLSSLQFIKENEKHKEFNKNSYDKLLDIIEKIYYKIK